MKPIEDAGGGRWRVAGGYGEVLRVAIPLILSTGSWSLMHFVDRMFLTWYSRDALAAALPAGLLSFTLGTFFMGTAGYVNTFVAQYVGAGRPERVGSSVWQGIHFSVASGILLVGFIPAAEPLFAAVGHDAGVQVLEVEYFQILCLAWVPGLLMASVGSFFSGRGDTRTVMWVNLGAASLNVVLDWLLIFGNGGLPAMGMGGAAWATVIAHAAGALTFLVLFLRPVHREVFQTASAWRPDRELFLRMMRFGSPNGIQFFVELMGFSLFILLVGRLGTVELAATNLTFNVNTLAFMPMIGLGVAVSVLVGQYLGGDRPDLAERATWSAVHICLAYTGAMAAAYALLPDLFLLPYAANADPGSFAAVRDYTMVLLRFVAVYALFDAVYIVFASTVKGAGDTRFVMLVTIAVSWMVMVVPVYLCIVVYETSLFTAWYFASGYIILLGILFYFRFRSGIWKSMRVIETDIHPGLETMREPDVHTI